MSALSLRRLAGLRPIPRLVLSLALGLLLDFRLTLPRSVLYPLSAALALAALLAEPHERRLLIPLLGIVGGALLGSLAVERAASDCRATIPDNSVLELRGELILSPPPGGGGIGEIDAEEVRIGRGRNTPCTGEVRIRGRRGWDRALQRDEGSGSSHLEIGAGILVYGRWQAYPPIGTWPRNPERSGILVVDSLSLLSPPEPGRHRLARLRASVQRRFKDLFPQESALAEAMLLARKEGIEFAERDRFARAGLAHLLAISGLHVGLISGTLLLLGGLLRLSPAATGLLTILTTIGYVLFLGAPHAATRAALQITLVLSSRLLQRPADPYSMIATAAFLILLNDPLALLDPGFQLSFAGTGGILMLRRRILPLVERALPRLIGEGIAVSIAATIATAPITVIHFGQFAPIGIIANLAAIPITGLAVPAIALSLFSSYLSLGLGSFLGGGAELLLTTLRAVAGFAASLPGAQVLVPRDSVVGWALALIGALLITGWLSARERRVRPAVRQLSAIGSGCALLIIWPLLAGSLHDGRLEIHAIDVGQGDAFAIRTPGGRWILVDAGPGGGMGYDAGRARVVPFLLENGARRVDLMVLTHPDSDHIGGAQAVLDAFEVGLVIDPGVAVGKAVYSELVHRARTGRLRWIEGRGDLEIVIDDVAIQMIEPGPELDELPTTNHLSVAFRLEYGRFAALFLGDAPAEVEEGLARRYGDFLRSDLLKVAHHGSRTSTATALLDAAEPTVAMISVGRRNRYGHPAPEVLARLEAREIEIWRTDLAGTITLRTGPDARYDLSTQR